MKILAFSVVRWLGLSNQRATQVENQSEFLPDPSRKPRLLEFLQLDIWPYTQQFCCSKGERKSDEDTTQYHHLIIINLHQKQWFDSCLTQPNRNIPRSWGHPTGPSIEEAIEDHWNSRVSGSSRSHVAK